MSVKDSKDNRYWRTNTSGVWIKKDGKLIWEQTTVTSEFDRILYQWCKNGEDTTYRTPEELGYKKELEIVVLYFKRRPTESVDEDTPLMKKVMKMKIRDEFADTWFTQQGRKWYVKTLSLGTSGASCRAISLTGKSEEEYEVICSKPTKISLETGKELEKQLNTFFFTAYEGDENEGNWMPAIGKTEHFQR